MFKVHVAITTHGRLPCGLGARDLLVDCAPAHGNHALHIATSKAKAVQRKTPANCHVLCDISKQHITDCYYSCELVASCVHGLDAGGSPFTRRFPLRTFPGLCVQQRYRKRPKCPCLGRGEPWRGFLRHVATHTMNLLCAAHMTRKSKPCCVKRKCSSCTSRHWRQRRHRRGHDYDDIVQPLVPPVERTWKPDTHTYHSTRTVQEKRFVQDVQSSATRQIRCQDRVATARSRTDRTQDSRKKMSTSDHCVEPKQEGCQPTRTCSERQRTCGCL